MNATATDVRPRRRWLRYSLRSLLILTAACGVALAMWVVPAKRQRRAVTALREAGCRVSYEFDAMGAEKTKPPQWSIDLLGVNYLANVDSISLPWECGDRELALAADCRNLQRLQLQLSRVSDAGLVQLASLHRLRRLSLEDTRVGDEGLSHLAGLTNLESLGLSDTIITDAGLAHLSGLTNLQRLTLEGIPIGDEGLAHLSGLTSLQELDLRVSNVTDDGLVHLQGLKNLQRLKLFQSEVSSFGVAKLQEALPQCKIEADKW